jgi:hypothetical protein
MTPKEKSQELVEKYDETLTYLESKSKAKQCALIAVDLAIEVETNIFKGKVNKSFWQEVKQEIEKL